MSAYGDDAGLTAWLAANGHTLPVGSPTAAVLRQRASVYIDVVYGPRFYGLPTAGISQTRAWPRTGAKAYGQGIASDVIPAAVVQASYVAAYQEAVSPGSLSATSSGGIKREKVGSLEVEYFEAASLDVKDAAARRVAPAILAVDGLLAPFMAPLEISSGPTIWSIG
jgi:hypothetical protein